MTQRKSLSKKIRFEVFKRDSFTCQYCGSKAPDVVLEVDHINPVKEGGENDIMNLVTSCFNCNRGKRDKKLSDKSVIEKQREQIKELNLRRQQLQMMLEWRDGIKSIEEDKTAKAISYWNEKISAHNKMLNDKGVGIVRKLVKKFEFASVLDAMDIAYDKYVEDAESTNYALTKVGGILFLKNAPEHQKQISYIKGICRNKFSYFNEKRASIALNIFYKKGGDLNYLQNELVKDRFKNWSQFMKYVEE